MDKLDKLIEIKLQELFEQWGASPFPSSGDSWYNGAYAPSFPSRRAIGIDDEEDEEDDEEEDDEEEENDIL
jgi:hypothetical protein